MTGGRLLEATEISQLRAALDRNDREVIELVQRAVARAEANAIAPEVAVARVAAAERRLGDRILAALELALDQRDIEVAAHLESALQAALTRFGGAGVVEKRDIPEGMVGAYERLAALRQRHYRE